MNEIFENDDLSKIVKDRDFVNCNQNGNWKIYKKKAILSMLLSIAVKKI